MSSKIFFSKKCLQLRSYAILKRDVFLLFFKAVIAQDYKPGKFNSLMHRDAWRCWPCNTLHNTGVKYNTLKWKSKLILECSS